MMMMRRDIEIRRFEMGFEFRFGGWPAEKKETTRWWVVRFGFGFEIRMWRQKQKRRSLCLHCLHIRIMRLGLYGRS